MKFAGHLSLGSCDSMIQRSSLESLRIQYNTLSSISIEQRARYGIMQNAAIWILLTCHPAQPEYNFLRSSGLQQLMVPDIVASSSCSTCSRSDCCALKTKSPLLKLYDLILFMCMVAYFSVSCFFFSSIVSLISATLSACFSSAIACKPQSSQSSRILPGYSTSQVASSTSSGKMGCAPVTAKNGEHPILFLTVIRSAHIINMK